MTKKTRRDDQIAEVIKEEQTRGRRPLAAAIRRDKAEKLSIVHEALRMATEEEFVRAMCSYGLPDGSAEMEAALKIWREYSS